MPPVIAAVITVGAAVAAHFVASAVVAALITIAASVATTLILRKKPKHNRVANQGQELQTKIDPAMSRQVGVGLFATGGSCHFVYTNTDDSSKPNRYLYRVIQLSDQPCHALKKVLDGTNTVSFSGDVTTGWRASNQYRSKDGAVCMWMRVVLGSFNAVADSTLVSYTNGVWTSSHKGTGLCYAIIKMDNDPDAFPEGEPQFTWVLEGAACYDDRKDSTVTGGSGTQRLADPSTWAYSENAAVITAQFLRGFKTNGVTIAGVNAEERDLNKDMLFSAYNTCDQDVTVDAGTEARYTIGYLINSTDTAAETLGDFQLAMDGNIFDRGGSITILPGATRTPAMNLTDEDIDWTAQKSWQPQAGIESLINCVTGNFIDQDQYFQAQDLPVLKSAQWETDDGGQRFTEKFSLAAVNRRTQGERITKRIFEYSRDSGTCAFVGGIWLLELEQGDWFTLSSTRWAFSSKWFEVQEITITKDLRLAIVGREVDPNNDTWDHSVDEKPRSDTTWIKPEYALPVPSIYATSHKTIDNTTGIQTFELEVGLTDPGTYGGFVKAIDVQYMKPDSSVQNAGQFPVDQVSMEIQGLSPAAQYKARARTTDGSRFSDWCDWVQETTAPGTRVVAGQVDYIDNTDPDNPIAIPVQDLQPAEPGATRGAPAGTDVAGIPAEDLVENTDDIAIEHLVATGNAEIARLRDRGLSFSGPAGETSYVLLIREADKRETADSEFAETFDLLGAVKPDKTAFVLNMSSVFVGPDESMATRLDTITATFEDHQGSIDSINQVLADESGVVARALLRVSADGHILGYDAYNDGTTGIFTFTADKFVIEDPDTGDQMFYVDEDGAKMHNVEVDKLTYSSLEPHFSGDNNGLDAQYGYQVMPGGIIMQWGKVRQNITDEQQFNIVFPIRFNTAVVSVSATPFLYTFSNVRDLWMQNIGTPTLEGCVFGTQAADHNGQDIDGFDWVAFGY